MSVLNRTVSCFKSCKHPNNPVDVNLLTWLTSTQHADKVERIRTTDDKEQRNLLKLSLPAITPSGTFTERKNVKLIEHSGLMCLDIDYDDNEHIYNWDAFRDELRKIKNVAYCGKSVSGNGYFVIIPIAYPEQHKAHFEHLKHDFLKFGVVLDNACKDVARLRIYSYDADAYFNHEAETYYSIYKPPQRKQRAYNMPAQAKSVYQRAEAYARKHCPGGYIQGQMHDFRFRLSLALLRLGVSEAEAESYINTHYPAKAGYKGNSIKGPYRTYADQTGKWLDE